MSMFYAFLILSIQRFTIRNYVTKKVNKQIGGNIKNIKGSKSKNKAVFSLSFTSVCKSILKPFPNGLYWHKTAENNVIDLLDNWA